MKVKQLYNKFIKYFVYSFNYVLMEVINLDVFDRALIYNMMQLWKFLSIFLIIHLPLILLKDSEEKVIYYISLLCHFFISYLNVKIDYFLPYRDARWHGSWWNDNWNKCFRTKSDEGEKN